MPTFSRQNFTNTPAQLQEYADRNAMQINYYVETGCEMDRKYYGATDSVEVLMSVVGVIIGKIGGPQFACRIEAHGSCVRRRGDIHHTVNIDLYEQQTAIHTVTFASNMDMMPMVGAVSAFCASNEIEFLQSHGIQNLGKR